MEDEVSTKMQHKSVSSELLTELMPNVQSGTVIPIISNSFRLDDIFSGEEELLDKIAEDKVEFDDVDLTIDEQLTKKWAEFIEYPMMDDHNLARVAQYFQVEQDNSERAKSKYLTFLKNYLLDLNETSRDYADYVIGAKNQVPLLKFSAIAKSLDYPRFPKEKDSLRLLAKLPLKYYITTSYFDFMERALEDEDKTPHSLVCFWSGGASKALPEHRKDLNPDIDITEKSPLVYHLFGLENYPHSMVLSEDDFMNFLVAVFEDSNTKNPIVPTYLKEALAERRLLLLGYHLRDWDFRVLFKFIMKFRRSRRPQDDEMPKGILIQLKPSTKKAEDEERSINYLKQYFGKNQFDVDWTKAERFIYKLSSLWDQFTGKV